MGGNKGKNGMRVNEEKSSRCMNDKATLNVCMKGRENAIVERRVYKAHSAECLEKQTEVKREKEERYHSAHSTIRPLTLVKPGLYLLHLFPALLCHSRHLACRTLLSRLLRSAQSRTFIAQPRHLIGQLRALSARGC